MDRAIDLDREKYIQEEILRLLQSHGAMLLVFATFFTLSLSILDYLVTPENFKKFLEYRLIWAFMLISIFYPLFKFKRNNYYLSIISVLTALTSAAAIELMILSFGGHQSPYYAGLVLVLVLSLGFLPLSFKLGLLIALSIYAIYFLPIIFMDDITNIRIFINNNIFFITFTLGILGWRYFHQRLLINKLALEYDLSKEKEQLEIHSQQLKTYSTQLEQLVSERTKELAKSEIMLKALFENANDGIIIMNKNGTILNANQRAGEMHGFEKNAIIGMNIELLEVEKNDSIFRERMERALNGDSLLFETQHYKKDGNKISLEVSTKAVEVEGNMLIQSFHRDITEKKELQARLFQSQKMDSIGTLAGGIAHDFNNILSGILGHVELIRMENELSERIIKRLNIIENTGRRAGVMVSKLLGFSRRSSCEILPFNFNDAVENTIKLLERVVDKKISIKMDLNGDLPLIEGDVNQVEQLIMNLIVNARDAMRDEGIISIVTRCVEAKRGSPGIPVYVPDGRYVLLRVSDTGCGMSEEITSKIFDPFFTTKERGKGTGLGLSMVYGIVKEHKGYINVESRVGQGSVFDIYIPASDKRTQVKKRHLPTISKGHETILAVDDEEDTLSFIKDALELHGYKVLAADNPISALDIFKTFPEKIALVITDIVMPLMNGKQLIEDIKVIKPNAKILAISGYGKHVIDGVNLREDIRADGFLQKPFESSYLRSLVRKILDEEGMQNAVKN